MIKLHEMAPVLTGVFAVDTVQLDIEFPKIQEQANRITSKGSSREDDKVLLHCLEGTVAELGCLNAISANYDIVFGDIYDPTKIEVKRLKNKCDIEVLEFNYRNTKPGLSLTTYLDKGIAVTEFLVLTSIAPSVGDDNEIAYMVIPKYVILSSAFLNYVSVNERNYFTHQVNISKMIENSHAIKVS
jgi:hypothetical protein